MAIDPNILLSEGRCLSCNSNASEADIILLALLQRIAEAGGGGGGAPGGPLNAVQFQSPLGVFAGSSDLTFNDATNVLALTGSQTIATSANTTALAVTGYSLTGADAKSMLNLSGTFNTTGNPVALLLAIADTASGATAKFMEFLGGAGGATSAFSVDKIGNVNITTIGALTANAPALEITQTWNNAAVVFTAVDINITATAADNASELLDIRNGATNYLNLNRFNLTLGVAVVGTSANFGNSLVTPSILSSGNNATLSLQGRTFSVAGTAVDLLTNAADSTAAAGQYNGVAITPVYNQAASTAANTDFLVNRTETAIGSGTQNLINLQVAGTSRFAVRNTGAIVIANQTSGPGASVGTLANAPSAGDPDFWLPININGTPHWVPAWA